MEIAAWVFIKEGSWDPYQGKGDNRSRGAEGGAGAAGGGGRQWLLQLILQGALEPEWP